MRLPQAGPVWLSLLLLLPAAPVVAEDNPEVPHKSGYDHPGGLDGPAAVRAQLEEDDRVKEPAFRFEAIDRWLKPWFETKQRIKQERGLQMGFDYSWLYQALDDSPTAEDDAWLGILRAYGAWTATGRDTKNTGTLVYKVDHRHRIGTELAPSSLGGQAGYLGLTGTLFSDVDLVLVDLNWQQTFNDGKSGLLVGRFDPNDYQSVLGYANPWTAFSNAWILLNPSIALPDGSLGIGAGSWFRERWYVKGSINDANGVVTDELDVFKGGAEFFKWGEAGWSPSSDERYFKNVHLSVWHVDDRDKAGLESAEGIALGFNWTFEERWMPFVKLGWSDGTAPTYNETATAGFIRYFASRSDLLGVGINWGAPPDDSLREQTSVEGFYRLQFAQNLAITPSVQLLIDPAGNPADDEIWVFSVRMRLTL